MLIYSCRNKFIECVVGLGLLLVSSLAIADPPGRIARLGYSTGEVSFSPAGQGDWVNATVNRPMTTGDSLWVDANARAELQIGGAAIRLGERTNLTVLNLDDGIVQLQLLRGALKIRIRHLDANQRFEVDTPNLAFSLLHAGDYRIDVDPNGNSTAVLVKNGEAEVYGDGVAYRVNTQQGYRFYGKGLSNFDAFATGRDDDLERWADERDRRVDNSISVRYVSTEVVGFEDLDTNGTWRVDSNYGNVWTPNRVAAGWTPYRDGHWAWVDPWGWTWVDDASWGYAVTHYGRWARVNSSWAWVPGPAREHAVYAPALVVFLGGKDFQVSIAAGGKVGWFPLGPREVYQPAYQVSRNYFHNVNRSNTVIAPTTITNIYNTNVVNNDTHVTNITKVVYVNQSVPGAVVAVPTHTFVQSLPVAKAAVVVPIVSAINAPAVSVAAVVPIAQSLLGGALGVHAKPVAHEHAVVVRTAPPAPSIPFAAQVMQLTAKPGAPIDAVHRAQLKPAILMQPDTKVNVVAVSKVAPPTAQPPASKASIERKADVAPAPALTIAAVGVAKFQAETNNVRAVNADLAKTHAAKADADRANVAKAEADKAHAPKVDEARAAAAKAEADRAHAAKAHAAKVETEKANAAKLEQSKSERQHASAPGRAVSH